MSRYTLLSKIAAGGMGEVYRASAAGVGGFQKTLVVKRIHPHLATYREFVMMFLNEARLAALLNHPNIVQIFDLGEEDGTYFIAMEYVEGPSLQGLAKAAMAQGQALPVEIVMKIGALCCEGLAYAHSSTDAKGKHLKLVHRDISPDNILLSRSGAVKVADFGIARASSVSRETQAGATRGKVSYLSPEALTGKELDGRADVWALGVVLFQALAGAKPFQEASPDLTRKAIVQSPPRKLSSLRPDVPAEVQRLLELALVKDPAKRINATDLGMEFEQLLVRQGRVVNTIKIAELVNRLMPPEVVPTPDDPDVLPADRFDASGRLMPPPPPLPDLPTRPPKLADVRTPESMEDSQTQLVRTRGPATEPIAALPPEALGDQVTGAAMPLATADTKTQDRPIQPAPVGADEALIARERARREAQRQQPRRWPTVVAVVAALAVAAAAGYFALVK